MDSHSHRRPKRFGPLLLALGGLALAGPCWAQNTAGSQPAGGSNATLNEGNTGAGPRGTKVGPSTEPGAAPPSPSATQTGVPPRGTKVAPSTPQRTQAQPKSG